MTNEKGLVDRRVMTVENIFFHALGFLQNDYQHLARNRRRQVHLDGKKMVINEEALIVVGIRN